MTPDGGVRVPRAPLFHSQWFKLTEEADDVETGDILICICRMQYHADQVWMLCGYLPGVEDTARAA